MSEKTIWKIQYINLCISEFGRKHHLSAQLAYRYLMTYQGLAFLDRNYEAEHTFALQDTLESLQVICHRNGGSI